MQQHAFWRGALFAALVSIAASSAHAQNYPDRPVKIISDSAPGSAVDSALRIIGDRLGHIWGQQVVIVNQPVAAGSIRADVLSKRYPEFAI